MALAPDRAVLGPDFFQAPLRDLEALRAEGPACPVVLPDGMRAWLVTDYAHARALLNDPRLSKARDRRAQLLESHGQRRRAITDPALSSHVLAADPPDHTRLRGLVIRAFTARRVAALRSDVERIVAELLDRLPANGETDLVTSVAFPLPIAVIGELLGVRGDERPRFRAVVDSMFSVTLTVEEKRRHAARFLEYLRALIVRTRATPNDTVLSGLIEARDSGDRLSEDELTSMAGLLLTAGYETTGNLIGNTVLTLLRHPDQLARVRANPGLISPAVAESLRFDSSVYLSTARFTAEEVTIADTTIPAGEIVFLALLAANHDPTRFPSPGRFDIDRDDRGHLAFGHGIHYCLGAQLARLEVETLLRALLARYDEIELTVDPDSLRWRERILLHGLERLPVRLRRAA